MVSFTFLWILTLVWKTWALQLICWVETYKMLYSIRVCNIRTVARIALLICFAFSYDYCWFAVPRLHVSGKPKGIVETKKYNS